MPLNLQGLNPQFLGLATLAAGQGNPDNLADILTRSGGSPPTTIEPPQQPFPLPPRGAIPQGAGTGGSGVLGGAGGSSSLPSIAQAAPQALAAAAPQSPLGGAGIAGLLGGGAGAGAALAGGLPNTPGPATQVAGGGVNPLEALVSPTAGAQRPAPRAIAPSPGGGSINPQIMQLILSALGAGQQPQQPAQSLGSILGQLR